MTTQHKAVLDQMLSTNPTHSWLDRSNQHGIEYKDEATGAPLYRYSFLTLGNQFHAKKVADWTRETLSHFKIAAVVHPHYTTPLNGGSPYWKVEVFLPVTELHGWRVS